MSVEREREKVDTLSLSLISPCLGTPLEGVGPDGDLDFDNLDDNNFNLILKP